MQIGGKILQRTPAQHHLLDAELDLRRNRNLRDRGHESPQPRHQPDRLAGVIIPGDELVGIELPRGEHGME